MLSRCRLLLALAAVPIVLAACGGPAQSGPATSANTPVKLAEAGSTLLLPLFRTWAASYTGAAVSTSGGGSGQGISSASSGKVDIGASDAFLSSGDMVKNPRLLNIPLVVSAQQVNYNVPGLPAGTHLNLNGSVLAEMYQGKITSWNDPAIKALNPGVPLSGTRVVPLHRSDSSGDTFLFTSYLSTNDPGWNTAIGYGTTVAWPQAPGAQAAKGNGGMVSACAKVSGCVAYVGISYLSSALSAGLGEAALANTAGRFLLPDPASIDAAVDSFVPLTPQSETISMIDGPAAAGYPIVNYEYAVISAQQPSAAKARALKAFLDWAVTTGEAAQYLSPVQFRPLPADVVSLSQSQIAKISSPGGK